MSIETAKFQKTKKTRLTQPYFRAIMKHMYEALT